MKECTQLRKVTRVTVVRESIRKWVSMQRFCQLICALLICCVTGSPAIAQRPVVFVPGIMGSKLCDAGEVVWGDAGSYLEGRLIRLRLKPGENLGRRH